jgi:gamma-glutamyl hydrolase
MVGETAILIPYDISTDALRPLLQRVQGLIWTGGSMPNTSKHTPKQYDTLVNTLFLCYEHAIHQNEKGNYYPIWATCLGMDILWMFATYKPTLADSLTIHKKEGNETCTFTETASRLKRGFSASMKDRMKREKCVFHHHLYGNDIVEHDHLHIVSIHDKFVNAFEFVKYPFYGVQFHPEQPHTDFGIQVSKQFMLFLKDECRKNKNKWTWTVDDFKKTQLML